jgi:putative ABC transport system permease protein
VVRKLLKMKWRAIAISMVVSLSMAMFVTGLYSAVIFDHSMDTFIEETNFPDIFISLSEPVNASIPEEILSSIPEVDGFSLRLKLDGSYSDGTTQYPAIIIGIEDPGREDINKLLLKDGDLFQSPDEGVVVAGMEAIGAKKGKDLQFTVGMKSFNISIAGTVQTAEYIFASSVPDSSLPLPGNLVVLFLDIERLREITGYGINDILINSKDGSEDSIAGALDELPVSSVVYQKDHPSVVFMDMGAGKMRNMFPLFSIIFMVVGVISIFMTFYRIVMNDSRYIGVLMSLGYSRLRIAVSYLSFGVVLATIGSVLGLIFGLMFTQGIMSYTISMIGDIRVAYPLDPVPFIAGFLFSFGSVLISVAIPILIITRKSVREALDHKPRTRILTVGNGSSGLSKSTLMGIRNTFRNPARTALTVLVVGMSIGIAGSWIVVSESAWGYMQEQTEQETWDLRIDLTTPMTDENATTLFSVEGTEYVIPFAYLSGQVSSGGDSDSVSVVVTDRMLEARDFEIESGKLDLSTSIITNKLANEMGISKGDSITVNVGPKQMQTTVGGIVYDILMKAVYVDRDTASSLVDIDLSSSVYVKLENKEDTESMIVLFEGMEGVSKVTVQDDIISAMDETFGSAMGMLYFFFIICLIIAMVVAASAIIISTMERDVEFATLETLGIPRTKVIGSLLIEVGIIGFFSAFLGLPFAYLFGKLFAVVMEEILYYFPVFFAFTAMIFTFVFGFLFIFGSSIFPIRYTKKLDVETTIRERTAG